MKTLLRALALSLVVTGAVASTQIARSANTTVAPRIADLPIPTCPPDDPSGCGMCQFSGTCTNSN